MRFCLRVKGVKEDDIDRNRPESHEECAGNGPLRKGELYEVLQVPVVVAFAAFAAFEMKMWGTHLPRFWQLCRLLTSSCLKRPSNLFRTDPVVIAVCSLIPRTPCIRRAR